MGEVARRGPAPSGRARRLRPAADAGGRPGHCPRDRPGYRAGRGAQPGRRRPGAAHRLPVPTRSATPTSTSSSVACPASASASRRRSMSPSPASRCARPPAGTCRPDHPIAVVVDAPAGEIPQAQGLVAELVQELPPQVPLSLASAAGAAGTPGLNRDAVMAALAHLKAGTPTTVRDGIAAAAASGVQHVFVVSTCALARSEPGPGRAWSSTCSASAPRARADGRRSPRPAPARSPPPATSRTGLAALDVTVARWRSSLVVVTQALTRDPLVLAVADDQVTAVLPGAAAARADARPPRPPAHARRIVRAPGGRGSSSAWSADRARPWRGPRDGPAPTRSAGREAAATLRRRCDG